MILKFRFEIYCVLVKSPWVKHCKGFSASNINELQDDAQQTRYFTVEAISCPEHRFPFTSQQPWSMIGGAGGETDESQGLPHHFTFPLLQPDRT